MQCAHLLLACITMRLIESEEKIDVTLVSHTTTEKLWMLDRLCARWRGPMSLALWLNKTESYSLEFWVDHTRRLASSLQGGCRPFKLEIRSDNDHTGRLYPVNWLRNIAVSRVETSHHIVSDMDFLPSIGLKSAVQKYANELFTEPKLALIVPAFQRRGGNCKTVAQCQEKLEPLDETIPRTFEGLLNCLESNNCIPFQSDNSPTSHSTTDVSQWLMQTNLREIKCFHSNRYEPYLVVSHSFAPPYDERFTGYGKNKIQHVAHLRRLGLRFAVLPQHFLVHVPHPRSTSKNEWIHSFQTHKAVDQLYDTFLKEIQIAIPTPPAVPLCISMSKRKAKNMKEQHDSSRKSIRTSHLRGRFEERAQRDTALLEDVHEIADRLKLPMLSSSNDAHSQRAYSLSFKKHKPHQGEASFSLDTTSHGTDDDDDR